MKLDPKGKSQAQASSSARPRIFTATAGSAGGDRRRRESGTSRRRPAVARELHVPEQRLAQRDERLLVPDVAIEIGRLRDWNRLQRVPGRHALRPHRGRHEGEHETTREQTAGQRVHLSTLKRLLKLLSEPRCRGAPRALPSVDWRRACRDRCRPCEHGPLRRRLAPILLGLRQLLIPPGSEMPA